MNNRTLTSRSALIKAIAGNPSMYLMVLPAVVILFIFHYIPIYGIIIAFQKYSPLDGYGGSPFVGLKNFIRFFNDPFAYRVIRNTLMIGIFRLIWTFWPPIVLALLLNELSNVKLKRSIQSISYLPHFFSTVIVVGILFKVVAVDGGVANTILKSLGFNKINFLVSPQWFRSLYITLSLWSGIGWGSIIYLAALNGIDPQLYEAAHVEGASRFQRAWHITLPGISSTIIILLILNVRSIVKVGAPTVLLMYNEAVYETADVLSTYVYRQGIQGTNPSYASAIGLFNSVISLLLVIIINRIARAVSETSLW
ncbi:MAG: ABC transporter permease subunit [Bacillota bacterium]|nr:ABC transporter permease subunit [Bacillota bacterium]